MKNSWLIAQCVLETFSLFSTGSFRDLFWRTHVHLKDVSLGPAVANAGYHAFPSQTKLECHSNTYCKPYCYFNYLYGFCLPPLLLRGELCRQHHLHQEAEHWWHQRCRPQPRMAFQAEAHDEGEKGITLSMKPLLEARWIRAHVYIIKTMVGRHFLRPQRGSCKGIKSCRTPINRLLRLPNPRAKIRKRKTRIRDKH